MRDIYKSYSELVKKEKFEDRFEYLCLNGKVAQTTFGGHRYLNQKFYQSYRWKSTRREVIIRDNGCDLAHEDYRILGLIYIHHINPITIEDILQERPCVFDLENLICVSRITHNAIHYGSEKLLTREPIVRRMNDTCLWR